MRNGMILAAALAVAVVLATGCTEKVISSGASFTQGTPGGGVFNPNKIPRLVALTPNAGPEAASTEFDITGANLLPGASVDITFGTQQFQGTVDFGGTRIVNNSSANGKYTAPPGTGTVDLSVIVNGQNPPNLSLPNAFVYLPPGSPAAPVVDTQTPNMGDEFGGTTMTFTGQNVPLASGYTIVATWLFGSGNVNVGAIQTANDQWTVTVPAVPAAENFTTGQLQVTVTVTFAGGTPALPAPIVSAAPSSPIDGNPYTYNHSGTPPAPQPEETVVVSGLWIDETAPPFARSNAVDAFVRTIRLYDPANDRLEQVPGLVARYMYNGSTLLAPNGTHPYPSPLMSNDVSFREANSSFAHFALPQFDRTYIPVVPDDQPAPPAVTNPVTARLYHCTNTESGGFPTGNSDSFFAVYSTGEAESFAVGGGEIHEEMHVHEKFSQFPYFAVTHDGLNRIFIGRLDGQLWVASGANTNEINVGSVTGNIMPLSLKMAGDHLYFCTDTGEVYHTPLDSGTQGVNPTATALNWPAGAVHPYVADEFNASGDGDTICFVAGTGTQRFTTQAAPPDTHNVFAIRNAEAGNTNITEVTNFAAPGKQIQIWNIDDATTSTYGSMNVDNGANDRRVTMAGVNAFSTATNRPGHDVVVNFDGELCAFVTREDRAIDGSSSFVVYYLYVARIGQGPNQVSRINSLTAAEFGIGNVFGANMTVIGGMHFPKKTPNSGMINRLVFTVATTNGVGLTGENQHLFTADVSLSGTGLGPIAVTNRSVSGATLPFMIGAGPDFHYFGGFQSRAGHVMFMIEINSGRLQYVDLRDGVSSLLQDITLSHSAATYSLPTNPTSGAGTENTYLPNGFAPDPTGSINLEHWGNQLRSLHGPGLNSSTQEYLILVGEENAGEEDVYIVKMNSLTSPLPSPAINISNVAGGGVIKGVYPSKDGNVMAFVKGNSGYPEGYRFAPVVQGGLYIINDIPGMLAANETALSQSATAVSVVGTKFSREMRWYGDPSRYTLYFGEGSSLGGTTGTPPPEARLRFTRIDVDRNAGNTIGAPTVIDMINGFAADEGAIYIYEVGKAE